MIIINTTDGKVIAGGLVQDGQAEVVLRDPANQLQKVPKAKIASRQMSPVSMMPPGLTATLREDEFVDLVRFLSELGKEGDYKIKTNRFVRTWKVMGPMEQADIDFVRHTGLQALHDSSHKFPLLLAYSKVNGELPLDELVPSVKMYPWFPKIAQFGLKLDGAGKVKLGLNETKGVIVVVGEKIFQTPEATLELDLPAGRTPVSVLATKDAGDLKGVRVEILEGAAQID